MSSCYNRYNTTSFNVLNKEFFTSSEYTHRKRVLNKYCGFRQDCRTGKYHEKPGCYNPDPITVDENCQLIRTKDYDNLYDLIYGQQIYYTKIDVLDALFDDVTYPDAYIQPVLSEPNVNLSNGYEGPDIQPEEGAIENYAEVSVTDLDQGTSYDLENIRQSIQRKQRFTLSSKVTFSNVLPLC